MLNKEVTIIILTYKSSHIVCNAIDKIIEKGYRIIIVDNGSNDDIATILQQNYPNSKIELILLEKNVGFSKGNNVALKMVKTKYSLLLNPDAIITEDSIDNMVIEADKYKDVAMVNPIFFSEEEPNKDQIVARIKDVKNDIEYIKFICCGASLMKMSIFNKIGFLDENIFLYAEDDEISHRVIDNNYKNILVKNAICSHINQASVKTENKWQKYRLIYFRSWHQGWGKTYLKKRKKNILKIWVKIFHRLLLSIFYLLKFDLTNAINRFAIFNGSIANLIGIDCFKKDNQIPKIKKEIIS
ncbi:glycosyltransferase family 2 protein [Rickettsiales bacterium]|nr:glycosyltransferase family 2 protein [Rickettsiales bacterium]